MEIEIKRPSSINQQLKSGNQQSKQRQQPLLQFNLARKSNVNNTSRISGSKIPLVQQPPKFNFTTTVSQQNTVVEQTSSRKNSSESFANQSNILSQNFAENQQQVKESGVEEKSSENSNSYSFLNIFMQNNQTQRAKGSAILNQQAKNAPNLIPKIEGGNQLLLNVQIYSCVSLEWFGYLNSPQVPWIRMGNITTAAQYKEFCGRVKRELTTYSYELKFNVFSRSLFQAEDGRSKPGQEIQSSAILVCQDLMSQFFRSGAANFFYLVADNFKAFFRVQARQRDTREETGDPDENRQASRGGSGEQIGQIITKDKNIIELLKKWNIAFTFSGSRENGGAPNLEAEDVLLQDEKILIQNSSIKNFVNRVINLHLKKEKPLQIVSNFEFEQSVIRKTPFPQQNGLVEQPSSSVLDYFQRTQKPMFPTELDSLLFFQRERKNSSIYLLQFSNKLIPQAILRKFSEIFIFYDIPVLFSFKAEEQSSFD